MTDIVQQLRESAEAWANEVGTRKEAADEIERLRAEVAHWQKYASDRCDEIRSLVTEAEKDAAMLRQALEELDGVVVYDWHGNPKEDQDRDCAALAAAIRTRLEETK